MMTFGACVAGCGTCGFLLLRVFWVCFRPRVACGISASYGWCASLRLQKQVYHRSEVSGVFFHLRRKGGEHPQGIGDPRTAGAPDRTFYVWVCGGMVV